LTDYLNGTVQLSGGYDLRPVDADGLNFQVVAKLIPEPGSNLLIALLTVAYLSIRDRRSEQTRILGERGSSAGRTGRGPTRRSARLELQPETRRRVRVSTLRNL
jgi:hypothetical protein